MTDGKEERLPLLPAECRQSTSGAATALSIDRSMTKRNSHLVADAQLSGAESRCRIWASTVEGAGTRVFWRNVVFEDSRRRVSDMKRACILTECARGQATGNWLFRQDDGSPGRCHCLGGHAVVGVVDAVSGE